MPSFVSHHSPTASLSVEGAWLRHMRAHHGGEEGEWVARLRNLRAHADERTSGLSNRIIRSRAQQLHEMFGWGVFPAHFWSGFPVPPAQLTRAACARWIAQHAQLHAPLTAIWVAKMEALALEQEEPSHLRGGGEGATQQPDAADGASSPVDPAAPFPILELLPSEDNERPSVLRTLELEEG